MILDICDIGKVSIAELFHVNISFRKNFSETEIEILVSKYDVDGNTIFTLNEINAIQDDDLSKLQDEEP